MARRKPVPPAAFSDAGPPQELLRIRWRTADDPRGFVTAAEVEEFLMARQRWREQRQEPLPPLDSLTRARVVLKGDIDPALVEAERAAPRGPRLPYASPRPVVDRPNREDEV